MKPFRAIILISLFVLLSSLGVFASNYQYPIKDAHCHFVDFVQNTDGIDVLIENMDKAEVEEIILFGLPVSKKWEFTEPLRPVYYDDDDSKVYYYSSTDIILARRLLEATEEERKRIHRSRFETALSPDSQSVVPATQRLSLPV